MSEFNFKSQVCTDKVQSERLLALGLKKETADMVLCEPFDYEKRKYSEGYAKIVLEEGEDFCKEDIPAWSLHRLLSLIPSSVSEFNLEMDGVYSIGYTNLIIFCKGYLYDNIIDCIEWLIKEGYFNKEYLV